MMRQLNFLDTPIWTVTRLTGYLRELLESDDNLQDVWVQGEISNFSRPSSGHLYFTLKDSSAALRCVMWRSQASRLDFYPKDGQAVEVHGSISLYEASGQYQLYADRITPAGEGQLYQEFLRLKARLEAEGMFASERKRAIPKWPRAIGIVTSPTGAALRDILHTLQRRFALVEVIIAPTQVQGDEAPPGIVAAIEALNRFVQPDLIILARGGGSIEDLWAFNDERVARAIADSESPVISGVGHETDFTIADFVCDLRAPTPTAAAELATPNKTDLLADLNDLRIRLAHATETAISEKRWTLNRLESRLDMRSPQARIRTDRQRLDELSRQSALLLQHRIEIRRMRLHGLRQQLNALNPQAILKRGYSVIIHPDGQVIHSVNQVQFGDALSVQVSDGQFEVQVTQKITSGEDSQ